VLEKNSHFHNRRVGEGSTCVGFSLKFTDGEQIDLQVGERESGGGAAGENLAV